MQPLVDAMEELGSLADGWLRRRFPTVTLVTPPRRGGGQSARRRASSVAARRPQIPKRPSCSGDLLKLTGQAMGTVRRSSMGAVFLPAPPSRSNHIRAVKREAEPSDCWSLVCSGLPNAQRTDPGGSIRLEACPSP